MNVVKWLQIGLRIGPVIVGAVHAVEALVSGLKGKDKQNAAIQFIGDFLPAVEGVAGRDLVDDAEVQEAMRACIDSYVHLQNVIASVKARKS